MNFFSKYIVLFIADKVTREPSSFLSVLDTLNIFLIPSHFLLSLIQKKKAAYYHQNPDLLILHNEINFFLKSQLKSPENK